MNAQKNREKSKRSETALDDTLRVLCLHGYRQNGDTFKAKIGSGYSITQILKTSLSIIIICL